MDTDVVEQSGPGQAPGGQPGVGTGPGSPEATVDEVDRLLDEVEAALDRLDEGTYGTCDECGRPIEDRRLSAEPTARTCAGCGSRSGSAGGDGEDPGDAAGHPVAAGEDPLVEPDPTPLSWAGDRGTVPDH